MITSMRVTLQNDAKVMLVTRLMRRLKTGYMVIQFDGAEDGETLELFANGKLQGVYTVQDSVITIPVMKDTAYRLFAQKSSASVKFCTNLANDGSDDLYLSQTFHSDATEYRNIYRALGALLEKQNELEKKLKQLDGYITE